MQPADCETLVEDGCEREGRTEPFSSHLRAVVEERRPLRGSRSSETGWRMHGHYRFVVGTRRPDLIGSGAAGPSSRRIPVPPYTTSEASLPSPSRRIAPGVPRAPNFRASELDTSTTTVALNGSGSTGSVVTRTRAGPSGADARCCVSCGSSVAQCGQPGFQKRITRSIPSPGVPSWRVRRAMSLSVKAGTGSPIAGGPSAEAGSSPSPFDGALDVGRSDRGSTRPVTRRSIAAGPCASRLPTLPSGRTSTAEGTSATSNALAARAVRSE